MRRNEPIRIHGDALEARFFAERNDAFFSSKLPNDNIYAKKCQYVKSLIAFARYNFSFPTN